MLTFTGTLSEGERRLEKKINDVSKATNKSNTPAVKVIDEVDT